MRTSAIVTVSLPPAMVVVTKKIARKKHMTQSELFRTALRRYCEELEFETAARIAEEELQQGKLKMLPRGGLAALLQKK